MSDTLANAVDASNVALQEWPQMAPPRVNGRREGGFQTVIKRTVLDQIHDHGRSNTEVEICGVLVGSVFQDEFGPYLYITDMIKGDAASQHATQVTFTAETWDHIQNVMDREHVGKSIVGWYHTHPGFDIFLSGMDLFIQDNFFNLPWQVALVYDPIGEKEGLFVWRKGKSEKESYLVEEDPAAEQAMRKPLPDLENLGKGPITRYTPTLYLTAFVIVFLGAYVALVQVKPKPQFAPPQASPGLKDDTAKPFDPSQMLEQMDDQNADEPAVDTSPNPPGLTVRVDGGI
jgi:proteasome lid subunit RPN8/RPN11